MAQPTAIAATSGRVLSKVAIAPAKPWLVSISGEPRRFSAGHPAVLEPDRGGVGGPDPELVLEPLRRSSRACPSGTTNDLIAARPRSWSRVAQTTTASERSPEVTKIFSPFRTYSSPSRTAVVRMLGRVGAGVGLGDRHRGPQSPNRSCCSASPTDAIAELPSPWRGSESSRPTSPQHISAIDHHRGQVGAVLDAAVVVLGRLVALRRPDAPAPELGAGLRQAVDHGGEQVELLGIRRARRGRRCG